MDRKEHHGLWPGDFNWRRGGEAHKGDRRMTSEVRKIKEAWCPGSQVRKIFYMITTKSQLLSLSFLICEMEIVTTIYCKVL